MMRTIICKTHNVIKTVNGNAHDVQYDRSTHAFPNCTVLLSKGPFPMKIGDTYHAGSTMSGRQAINQCEIVVEGES